jgi:hypothetical protein
MRVGDLTTCPECGEPLYAYEEWELIDKTKIGEPVGESIQGDYAHADCL